MRALVLAGIVQGFSTPPLMLLIMIMTNRRSIMGDKVNGAESTSSAGRQRQSSSRLLDPFSSATFITDLN
jgi:hypothetical protein